MTRRSGAPGGEVGTLLTTPARPSSAIELRGVSKVFKKRDSSFEAVTGVDLSVRPGEFVVLVGPSGCGKTTLLRLMAGLEESTRGSVLIHGEVVSKPRGDVGLMLQQPTLFPWRTALANVLLPVDVHRRRTGADIERAMGLLGLVNLDAFAHRHPRELSGGMQQRVALCRVLMTNPRVMLLDEPFGALDEFTRERLNLELATVVESNPEKAVILVTHSIAEAVFLGDRVVAMGTAPGRVLAEVEVGFERPKRLSLMRSSEFHAKVDEVRNALGLG